MDVSRHIVGAREAMARENRVSAEADMNDCKQDALSVEAVAGAAAMK